MNNNFRTIQPVAITAKIVWTSGGATRFWALISNFNQLNAYYTVKNNFVNCK